MVTHHICMCAASNIVCALAHTDGIGLVSVSPPTPVLVERVCPPTPVLTHTNNKSNQTTIKWTSCFIQTWCRFDCLFGLVRALASKRAQCVCFNSWLSTRSQTGAGDMSVLFVVWMFWHAPNRRMLFELRPAPLGLILQKWYNITFYCLAECAYPYIDSDNLSLFILLVGK